MLNYLMVALGGAVGACARYAVYNVAALAGFTSQVATALINVLGAGHGPTGSVGITGLVVGDAPLQPATRIARHAITRHSLTVPEGGEQRSCDRGVTVSRRCA